MKRQKIKDNIFFRIKSINLKLSGKNFLKDAKGNLIKNYDLADDPVQMITTPKFENKKTTDADFLNDHLQ